jgi:hypothetical protein
VTRERRLADDLIGRYSLDLSGLRVLTEAASGPYLYTPLLAALAGAEHVFAWTRDSRFGSAADVRADTERVAREWGVMDRIEVTDGRPADQVGVADVITNSGFVRPIDSAMVQAMKPTAVVPLMWETWEFRNADLDLAACRAKGVLVLGTREGEPPCDMRGYAAAMGVKLAFELGVEVHRSRILLLGAQPTLGRPIHDALAALGAEVTWVGAPYDGLAGVALDDLDAIIVAEHQSDVALIGGGGALVDAARNPSLPVGVVAGNVDAGALRAAGVRVVPDHVLPAGYMSYQPSDLGPLPVLDLYAAGLKVGQEMARARIAGLDGDDALATVLERAPAMDFPR